MTEGKKSWKLWQKLGLGCALILLIVIVAFMSFRRRWIEPLPGVRMTLDFPTMPEEDLGPESGYRMLCEALLSPPAKVPELGATATGWLNALAKLRNQPWPESVSLEIADPPPASTPPGAGLDVGSAGTPWTADQCSTFLRFAKAFEPKIARIDKALAAPLPPRLTPGEEAKLAVSFDAIEASALARWLALSAEFRAATGDMDGAFADLSRLSRMGRVTGRNLGYHNFMVAYSVFGRNACTSAWHISTGRDVPAHMLRAEACRILDLAADMPSAADLIRLSARQSDRALAECCKSKQFFPTFSLVSTTTSAPSLPVRAHLVLGLSSIAAWIGGSSSAAVQRNVAAYHERAVALAEAPYSSKTVAAYESLARVPRTRKDRFRVLLTVRDPMGYWLASSRSQLYAHMCKSSARSQAAMRGTALFLAVKAYEKDKGHIPDTLNELVPEYLPSVPADPFGGRPFGYLKSSVPGLPPKAWAVYSVGNDSKDNGGTAKSVSESYSGTTPNPDLVWPSEPYPKPVKKPASGK
jgi:hypothetical protein